MTNPNNIVRVRARRGGRSSVQDANDAVQVYSAGVLMGHGVLQNTSADMNVLVGGSNSVPDVLVAAGPSGYKYSLSMVGQQAVAITAPASNSRITSIVAYTDDVSLESDETDVTGSPATCGLIVVNGDSAASPSAPDDASIRSAITADGATGSQAAYVVIANITVASSTTAITNSLITNNVAKLTSHNIDFATFEYPVNSLTPIGTFVGSSGVKHTIYRYYFDWGFTAATDAYQNYDIRLSAYTVLGITGVIRRSETGSTSPILSSIGDATAVTPTFTNGGAALRIYNHLPTAQNNARLIGHIDVMD